MLAPGGLSTGPPSAHLEGGVRAVHHPHLSGFDCLTIRSGYDVTPSKVVAQCQAGVYKIASWADFVNAHSLPGPGIVDGLKQALGVNKKAGILLLAEM